MPNRILKESILTSPNLNRLSASAERHFYRVLVITDDYGCYESTTAVLKGRCYPLKDGTSAKEVISCDDINQWQSEMEAEKLIRTWLDNERGYSVFLTFDEHNSRYSVTDEGKHTRHRRKTPPPPADIVSEMVTSSRKAIGTTPSEEVQANDETKEHTYKSIYEVWNEGGGIKHKSLTPDIKKAINKALKASSAEEIITAIKNYSEIVLNPDRYFFDYKWSLTDFLSQKNAMSKFTDIEIARHNFRRKGRDGTLTQKGKAYQGRPIDNW